MKFVAFTAENPNAALERVHEELGPDAVIVSVRKLRPEGLSWLWQRGRRLEVTACVQEKAPVQRAVPSAGKRSGPLPAGGVGIERRIQRPSDGRWRSIGWLESNGLLPAFSRQLEEKVRLLYGGKPLPAMQSEWTAITDLIICHWLPARQPAAGTGRPHVFIGPPGAGKTTALCKWMASAVLSNDQDVHVWRLDADSANNSELLELHCEMMGVPVHRFWDERHGGADIEFVDLPGVEIRNGDAMSTLRDHLSILPDPHVHLVLNAAYESSILFEQFRAFESFGPEDIIFTHLDEEHRRVKLWNFVLGTKCPISFLGAGQKIPGEFCRAEPSLLFPQKSANKCST
jgi:flagellar biosynthesis protein FlhF